MLSYRPAFSEAASAHKFEHMQRLTTKKISDSAVALQALKMLEQQLHRKNFFLRHSFQSFHPLWFLAETERNVFLWRNKLSLSDADSFDFLIDVPAFIQKRLEKSLDPNRDLSRQMNLTQDLREPCAERAYLREFENFCSPLLPHINALSRAALRMEQENGTSRSLGTIVLPAALKVTAELQ